VSSVCRLSVCDVLYCGETVRPSQKLSEEVIGNQGQKVDFWVAAIFLLPVLPLRPLDGRFCLIFARSAQQSVLDATNGLSSSKPYAYCRIVRSELKLEVVLATIIDPETCE